MTSTFALSIIVILVVYLCFLQIQIIKHCKGKNEKAYCTILLLLYILCNTIWYLFLNIIFPFDLIIICGYLIIIGFFYIYHILNKHFLHREQEIFEVDSEFQDEKAYLHEFMRKFFHFFIFGGTLLFLIIYQIISVEVLQMFQEDPSILTNPWEDVPGVAQLNENFILGQTFFYYIPRNPAIALTMFFMLALPAAIIVENFRLNPKLGIPLHSYFKKNLRESEQHNVAHYYYFIFGLYISAVLLPAICVFGILCVLCFGDTFASLIGKRVGKHKIRWESEKSWEGAFAGLFFTFITAIIFVGWFVALILGLIFIFIDVLTPNKLKVSDNFLYPLVCVAVLFFMLLFGYRIDSIMADFFYEISNFYLFTPIY